VLEGLEMEAREGRKRLWADPHPVPVQVLLGSPLRMKDRPSKQPSASPRLFSSSPHSAQKFSLKLETEEVDFSRTLTYPST